MMEIYISLHDLIRVGNKVTEVIADAYRTLATSQAAREIAGDSCPPTIVIVPASDPDRVWICWLFASVGAETLPVDFGDGQYGDGEVIYQLTVPIQTKTAVCQQGENDDPRFT